jgi:hypothetical protein
VDLARLGIVALCGMLTLGAAGTMSQEHAAIAVLPDLGPQDDALRVLFTPAPFPKGTFVVHRTPEVIGRLAARLRAVDPSPAPGAWEVERAGVFDAFGSEGPYDKARLARLFGGTSPWVVRGSLVTTGGRRALTLIAPYPDAALSTLRQGTMVIVTKLPVE